MHPAIEKAYENQKLFINNLAKLKKEKGIKFSEIEDHTGISSGYMSKVFKGERTLSFPHALLLANYFELNFEDYR